VIRAHRPAIRLRGVPIHVSPEFRLELHLDSDDAKALGLKSGDQIELQPHARFGRREKQSLATRVARLAPLRIGVRRSHGARVRPQVLL
jgi:hypothetical protein